MKNIPDDPIIRCIEATGYPPWLQDEEKVPRCPICGDECDTVYKDKTGDIVGCDQCLRPCDAYDEYECFEEDEE